MKRTAPLLLVAILALAGCSQVAAIAPVGGDRLAEVRFAGLDLLVGADVDVMTAPVCEADGATITCTGETMTAETITISSDAATPETLQVVVAGETLYDGSLQDVLEQAMVNG